MLLLILFAGFLLRLPSLTQSLWLDEASTVLAAKISLSELFGQFMPGDFHPPLYYLVMKFWVWLFGASEIMLRLPSVIFGMATVFLVYKIAIKMFDRRTGLVAATLAATSGLLIYYSGEARMYMMVAFLVAQAFYLFLAKRYVLFSLVLVLIGLSDYVALFVVPVFFMIAKNKFRFLRFFIPLALIYIAWLPLFIKQLAVGLAVKNTDPVWWEMLGNLNAKNLGLIPVKFILGRISFDNDLVYFAAASVCVGFYAALLLRNRFVTKILWYWVLIPISLGVIISLKIPTLTYFRYIFCLPAIYILAAHSLQSFKGHMYTALVLLAISINLSSSSYYLLTDKFHREDWRGAVARIGRDTIISVGKSQQEALSYYGKGTTEIRAFKPGAKKVWLLRYVWPISDPHGFALKDMETRGYNKEREWNFRGVEFWEYSKK